MSPPTVDKQFKRIHGVLIVLSILTVSGCATVPEPFTRDDIRSVAAADRQQARAEVELLAGPLTLEDALARGLKYNLDHRTRMLEQSLATGQLDAGRFDMLPKLMASAGYSTRNNDAQTYQPNFLSPGNPSTALSPVGADRTHTTTELGLSWNVLDFGLSYYSSKQNADRVLVAAERRRKAMHNLIQNIRSAFWRAASAEKLKTEVAETIKQAEAALADARQVGLERVKAPAEALRYQRTLLENLRTLEGIERELAAARVELAQLTNIPVGSDFRIAEPKDAALDERLLQTRIEEMEELAITNNADLREQFYSARIAATETRKAMLKLFPALSFNASLKGDTNRFLVNDTWNESAAQIGFNLLSLLSGPSQMEVAEAGSRLADQRRMAQQMALIAQVHLARQEFITAKSQFHRADAIWSVDNQLFELTSRGEAAQTQSLLNTVASRTAAILSLLRRYQALAQAHTAASKLQATLGLEPAIGNLDETSLEDLRKLVVRALLTWESSASETAPLALAPRPAPRASAPASTATQTTAAPEKAINTPSTTAAPSTQLAAIYADRIGRNLAETEFSELPVRLVVFYGDKNRAVNASLAHASRSSVATLVVRGKHSL